MNYFKKRKGYSTQIYAGIIVILLILGGGYWYYLQTQQQPAEDNGDEEPTIPEFSLTLIDVGGNETILNEENFESMNPIELISGLMTSAGSITSIATYTAIPIFDLIKDMSSENSLRVTAADDYSMVFTWSELNGEFITYDPVTGDEVENNGNITPCLAYLYDGEPLIDDVGPLRMILLSEEGLITEGHFWVKQVVKIEVIQAVQEYELNLIGYRSEAIDRPTFESGANCPDSLPNHKGVYVDSDDKIWTGIPLWLLVGRVDDGIDHTMNAYNREMADKNAYIIKLIDSSGDYSVELNSSFVKMNENIILANELDGAALPEKYWPLRLVGYDLEKSQMIRNVATIELIYNETWNATDDNHIDWGPDWNVTLSGYINETIDRSTFIEGATCPDINHSAIWIDGEGHEWSGIPLWLLLGRVDDSENHGPNAYNSTLADNGYTVWVKASDGYMKPFESSLVKYNNDLIIAYSYDGSHLPIANETEEKTYFPLRVVGPELSTGQMVYNISEIFIEFSSE